MHCPTHGYRGDAPREQNRRQAPFKRAAKLRLTLKSLIRNLNIQSEPKSRKLIDDLKEAH